MFIDSNMPPGVTTLDYSLQWNGQFGRPEAYWPYGDKRISGAARDAGHSTTTILRGGLLMGVVTATKLWKEWNPSGTDGSQWIRGILMKAVDTQRNGSNQNRLVGSIAQFGDFKGAQLLIPGEADYGIVGKDAEFMVRDGLIGQFRLDDFQANQIRQCTITADTTLDYTYHGALIDNIGASGTVVLTLPTPRRGFRLRILQQAGQIITLASSASNEFIPQSGTPASSINLSAAVFGISELVGMSTALYSINIDDT
jgi:hypothetical protein